MNADLEKNSIYEVSKEYPDDSSSADKSNGSVEEAPTTIMGKFNKFMNSMNAETRGIERIPEEEQTDTSMWNTASMFFGCNMVIATVSIGCLGITVFGLDFWSAFLTIVFFNFLGTLSVAFFSTFGPYFGLRQMVLTRFWFGAYTVKIPAFINLVSCVGWTAVNTIVSAQLLHTVNNGSLPPWAGVLIISLITFVVTFFGYHVVHQFEKYSWIPNVTIFLIMAIRLGMSKQFTYGTMVGGRTTAGNVLSFGATVYGFATGWTAIASDYTAYKPKSTSRLKIFFSVYGGLNFPLMVAMILGAAMATGTIKNTEWAQAYEDNSIGGLFYMVLVQDSLHGFGQFCLVLLALSTVSNNTPNLYSLGLTAQTFWEKFRKIPRGVWTLIGTGVSIAISIPAYYIFDSVISNFMNLIGYWLAIYTAISASEHFFFKKGFKGYNPEDFDNAKKLPPGIAAGIAFAFGAAGTAVGMAQVWWTGPLAKPIGTYGGDIGFELAFGFAFVVYNCLRPFELKYFGR
ncbi:uncharacterized protein SAPINGB_P000967 [Magnusiomyces paraingens]|uniref:Purine-cytosine permease n=1 Tax=Magnusiomyces paraingens TaxID=2606893 RepID=A0A5E8B3X0_9ASCO|nr:uncharacterized protein SAPINGB_P000967 [Saprochaete ingens]VVT45940.1 unnamed protein product [Saprochaete ingens]